MGVFFIKASIIIPTLNEEEYIENSLKQFLAQSYSNLEIIVVDGGSTDNTQKIVKSFSELHSNVKLIVAERSGPAKARNVGCKESTGEVIFLIDADMDSINKEFVERAMAKFEDEDVVGVYPKTVVTEHTLIERTFKYRSESTEEKEWDIHPPILRKETFAELGGYPNIGMGEDRFFSKKLFYLVMKTQKKLVNEYSSVFKVNRVHTIKEYYKQQLWYGRTYPLFAKISGYGIAKYASFYVNTIFMLLLFFAFLIPFYPILVITLIPFIMGLAFFTLKGIKRNMPSVYITLYTLYIIGGLAKGIGFTLYIFGKRDSKSKL